jgi:hypothetical protein
MQADRQPSAIVVEQGIGAEAMHAAREVTVPVQSLQP